jgi:hypothetical protein
MLILVSGLLLAIGLAGLGLTGLLLWLQVWLLAILRLLEGQFIRAGWWLCVALLPFNVLAGESFMPLYATIMVVAVGLDVWKLCRQPGV